MPTDRRWLTPVAYAAWFGVLSGYAETAMRVLRRAMRGGTLPVGTYSYWMPALANLVLFVAAGLLIALVARGLRRHVPASPLLIVLAGVALIAPLWVFSPPFHMYAVLALAAGGGVQAGRVLARRREGFDRLVRRTLPALVAAVLLIAVGIEGARALRESRALAIAPADRATRPNVLLLVLDTVRSMNLSLYGYFRPTSPQIARLAHRGVRFDGAVATAPWTLPSHGSMFTGRWPHEQTSGWKTPLDGTWPTLAEQLTAQGYATAGFVGNYAYCNRENGLARGFAHYEDFPLSWQQVLISSKFGSWLAQRPRIARLLGPINQLNQATATSLSTAFLEWSAAHTDRPYFAFINYLDAHSEYYWPPDMDSLYRDDAAQAPPRPEHIRPVPEGKADMRPEPIEDYDRAITYIDREIGRILDELDHRGQLDETLVIVTSDHGEEFWEHGMVGHGKNLYNTSLSVPLVVALPGTVPSDRVEPTVVTLRDLPATIMDLSGADSTAPFPGNSLARLWDSTAGASGAVEDTVLAEVAFSWNGPGWYPVSRGDMRSLYDDTLHLIRNGDGSHELYDLSRDPWEQAGMDPGEVPGADSLAALLAHLPGPLAQGRAHERRKESGE